MTHRPSRRPAHLVFAGLVATIVVAAQALLVPLLVVPLPNQGPLDLPAAATVRLEPARPGTFEITGLADAAAGRTLCDRETRAAFVAGPGEPRTSPGGSSVGQWLSAASDRLAQVGELPLGPLLAVLGGVMLLDAIPLLGVLVPGDVAVLAAVGTRSSGGVGAMLAVIAGCLAGWSLTFLAGRHLGARLRHGWLGAWFGEARWAAAERALGLGGGRMVIVAPFLPVLNALLPLAAGGLRMSYRRFVLCAALGAVLWAGLYVVLGTAARSLGGFLPGESFTFVVTTVLGMIFGWVVLLGLRKRLKMLAVR